MNLSAGPAQQHDPARIRSHPIAILAFDLVSLALGIHLVLVVSALWLHSPYILANLAGEGIWVVIVLVPIPLGLTLVDGIPLAVVYLGVLSILSWAILKVIFARPIVPPARGSRVPAATARVGVTQAITVVLGVSVSLAFLFTWLQGNLETPGFASMPRWEQLFLFTTAAVWEELITRVVWIGIPLAIAILARGGTWRTGLRALRGGDLTMNRATVFLILLSAGIFGFAHVASIFMTGSSAGGWGLWKLLPTFIGGIILGMVFVRFGLHASIAVHLYINTLGMVPDLLGSRFTEVPLLWWEFLLDLSLLVVGLVVMVAYLTYAWRAYLARPGRESLTR